MKLNHGGRTSREQSKAKKLIYGVANKPLVAALAGATLGLLLSLPLCFYLYDINITQKQQAQVQDFTRQRAELAAQKVADHYDSIIKKIEFYARKAKLQQAIVSGDKKAQEQYKNSIKKQIKDTAAIHFLKVGEAELNSDMFPPIRFSEKQLIGQVEKGERVEPEAVKIEKRWLLNVFLPAADADNTNSNINGIVWLTTDLNALRPMLAEGNSGYGEIALYQNFGPRSRVLVTKTGVSDWDIRAVARINSSQWEVEFAANSKLVELTHVNIALTYFLMLAVGVGFTFGLCASAYIVVRRSEIKLEREKMEEAIGKIAGVRSPEPRSAVADDIDVVIAKEDESLLGLDVDDDEELEISLDDDVFEMGESADLGSTDNFAAEVFRAYDIRGLANSQLDKDFALALGQALGSEVLDQGESTIVVARDARTHSPQLTEWLMRGILGTGCHVLNIGTVPTPLMYFTIETMDEVKSGVMVTASHNGAEYNGFKIVINGVTRSEEDIQALRKRMLSGSFAQGQGQENHHDIMPNYIDTIFSDVALAGEMKVVIDAGNGVAGKVAPKLFEELGCRVFPLYCDLDGTFPNHPPDPSREENLQDLIVKVKETSADIGIALDGDGDRLTVVSPTGEIIWADRMLMLFAKDIISRSPGADVVFDVKSTRHLNACVASYGGRPIMWKTGHSLMKQKMIETGAVVGAEYSGHIFIKDRWFGFDDGMYAAARLLEILSLQGDDIDAAFSEFPKSISTPEIRVSVDEQEKFNIIDRVKLEGSFGEGRMTVLDGVRVDFGFGWGLIRASNTGAELTMRFEADNEEYLHKLKSLFVRELKKIDSTIDVNWNQ